ncbi:hypothetical protein O4J56_15325 [Nocardiopsis sp. RSe5-2]|uniref:Uncharacterized protein n=1 Tax=Nocardiopsis endophytica TaxID=3018445 RepID=A0ABT4U4Y0_9ACTN|nr:hypothetical protein [Nocardiopsis endophytica]MDA2812013.1 hypothetical protein [Nocardiopsis endophytica]
MDFRAKAAAIGAVAAACAAAVAVLSTGTTDSASGSAHGGSGGGAAQGEVLLAHGSDHLPSRTASDWVTYADHVVVVSVAAEREIPPSAEEEARGEGLVGRELTLDTERVLWSRDGAPPAPDTWEYAAAGYAFTGGTDQRRPMALAGRPRIEQGHTYILAMVWEEARCAPGEPAAPAEWRGLGEGSEVPFDDGVIGKGEFEGAVRSAADAQSAASAQGSAGSPDSLEDELAGEGADALIVELESARPQADAADATAPGGACD